MDWCFCHMAYHSDNYFQITYNSFKIDASGDEMLWYKSYKKMPSKLVERSSMSMPDDYDYSFEVYTNILQAQWTSEAFQLLFEGVNLTITAKF